MFSFLQMPIRLFAEGACLLYHLSTYVKPCDSHFTLLTITIEGQNRISYTLPLIAYCNCKSRLPLMQIKLCNDANIWRTADLHHIDLALCRPKTKSTLDAFAVPKSAPECWHGSVR